MNTFSKYVIGFAGVITVLVYSQSILVPFIFALLLWFTIRVFSSISENIPIYGKYIPKKLKKIFSSIFIFSILYFFSQIVLSSFNSIIQSHHDYNDNISNLITLINEQFKIDLEAYIKTQTTEISIAGLAEILFDAISNMRCFTI